MKIRGIDRSLANGTSTGAARQIWSLEARAALVNRLTRSWNLRRLHRRMAHGNVYSGEFATFDEARASLPRDRTVGYDNRELAGWYRERLGRVQNEDYPILFWLSKLLPKIARVFDFGGHVGLHYHAWRSPLRLPAHVGWQVCDVPAVVEAGRLLAGGQDGAGQLSFTSRPPDADGADVFLASGSAQYLEPGFLRRSLASFAARPPHVLLNKLPVHDTRSFVTVQDTRAALHPYTVTSRRELDSDLASLGYRRVDAWKNPLGCRVLLRPDLDVPEYSGEYWTLERA